jgi:hypothetical protein
MFLPVATSSVVDLIEATVRLEQPLDNRQSTLGTGFVVLSTAPDGAPRTILITAGHVLANMPNDKVSVGLRRRSETGDWTHAPVSVRIRDAAGAPIWTRHPTQDVAAIELPPGLTASAIPVSELPGERALENLGVQPGDEMMVLGYPHGVAANPAGFPILRSGRVASYPLSPADRYPTYLVDLTVFEGNSGGPVYMLGPQAAADGRRGVTVTGLLTQQLKLRGDRLDIGNVTQADFITETISLMGAAAPAEVSPSDSVLPATDGSPASETRGRSAMDRLKEAWADFTADLSILVQRAWIVLRDAFLSLVTPAPRRM